MTGNPKLFLSRTGYREVDAATASSASELSPGADINGVLFTGANNITIPFIPMTWNDVAVDTQAVVDNGYVTDSASLVLINLPMTAVFGSIVRLAGKGTGGWQLMQNAGQIIHFGDDDTTTGVTGSLSSTNRRDAIELVCSVTNNEWTVLSCQGNIFLI